MTIVSWIITNHCFFPNPLFTPLCYPSISVLGPFVHWVLPESIGSDFKKTARQRDTFVLKNNFLGFPRGPVVKNPPAKAGNQFDSWSGKIPHAAGQQNPGAITTEPKHSRTCASQQKKPPQWESHRHRKRSPHSLQLEKVRSAMKIQCSQK